MLENFKFSPMSLHAIKSTNRMKKIQRNRTLMPSSSLITIADKEKNSLKKSRDNNLLASGGGDYDSSIYIWNLKTGKKVQTLPGHNRHITTITQLPDRNILVSGSYDAKIFLWNLDKAEPVTILNKHTFWIFNIKVLKCKTRMASCGWDRVIYIWKIFYDESVSDHFVFKDIKVETVLQDNYEVSMMNTLRNNTNVLVSSKKKI